MKLWNCLGAAHQQWEDELLGCLGACSQMLSINAKPSHRRRQPKLHDVMMTFTNTYFAPFRHTI